MTRLKEYLDTRYAYLSKKDPTSWGLLQAASYKDARKHLGSDFHIKTIKLPLDERHMYTFNKLRQWRLLHAIFTTQPIHLGEWDGEYITTPTQKLFKQNDRT